jgi:hypothetical protein
VPETRIGQGGGDLPTYATVTPTALRPRCAASTAGLWVADPLGKLDDRLDQLLPLEQGEVVVVGARDLYDPRLPGRRCRDRAALLGRHD